MKEQIEDYLKKWAVFDFDGSELINKRDCSDNEALEFLEKLYGGGEIIRVID